jgi:hypothetical protein
MLFFLQVLEGVITTALTLSAGALGVGIISQAVRVPKK